MIRKNWVRVLCLGDRSANVLLLDTMNEFIAKAAEKENCDAANGVGLAN